MIDAHKGWPEGECTTTGFVDGIDRIFQTNSVTVSFNWRDSVTAQRCCLLNDLTLLRPTCVGPKPGDIELVELGWFFPGDEPASQSLSNNR